MQETKKAFRKLPNLEQALTALSNLKGVGITMASALLAAAAPDIAPFMADECLMAIPDIDCIGTCARSRPIYNFFPTEIRSLTDSHSYLSYRLHNKRVFEICTAHSSSCYTAQLREG